MVGFFRNPMLEVVWRGSVLVIIIIWEASEQVGLIGVCHIDRVGLIVIV
jgi:hypothetical protein